MRGTSRHPGFMENCPTCSHMSWPYQSTKWFVISPFHVVWGARDSMATRDVPLAKKVDMKCMQVNKLKNIVTMTRRLCVLIMSHTHFRVNLHSVVAWLSRNSLLKTHVISEVYVTATGFEPTTTDFVKRTLNHLANLIICLYGLIWLNAWVFF